MTRGRQARRKTAKSPPKPRGSDRGSRAEHAYLRLREAIRGGALKPGDELREVELAARLGVSRTPVREAIRRLTGDGLVEPGTGRSLAVTRFGRQQVRELYVVRGILEGAAAELAARHATTAEIAVLRDLLAAMRGALDDPGRTAKLNTRLHAAIHEAGRNAYLTRMLEPMAHFIALLPGTTFEVAGRPDAALAEHAELVDAISAGDAPRAGIAARRHIERAGETRIRMMFDAE
jgi:DNA-binding GntR family transcriptional regulator